MTLSRGLIVELPHPSLTTELPSLMRCVTRVYLIEAKATILGSCYGVLVATQIIPGNLSPLEPLTIINNSIGVVELTHLSNRVVSMLIYKLY